ncbi:hypothetical protein GCM10011507_29200 [Edaphobacter acidisoli]|uniref:Uncharacterized protein n=1 Tax=Edaphobacter acidisoli TaxID=2040573 RepID=A0A916W8P2_9BACT|nr:hypothetical protein GCM10011507_29200 [Edaphobacter acidisoli]
MSDNMQLIYPDGILSLCPGRVRNPSHSQKTAERQRVVLTWAFLLFLREKEYQHKVPIAPRGTIAGARKKISGKG